jgi:hypothetical protein
MKSTVLLLAAVSATPLTAQQFLVNTPSADFGRSVALSADGSTALIGAPGTTVGSNDFQGSAFVYTRSGTVWSLQTVLTEPASGANAGAVGDGFGTSVALSADGNTAIVGALGKVVGDIRTGAAIIFSRSGGVWTQSAFLSNGSDSQQFGTCVAISGDGKTFLASGAAAGRGVGAAYLYGPIPTSIGFILGFQASFTDNQVGGTDFGTSCAMTPDGNNVAIGAPRGNTVSAFSRVGTSNSFDPLPLLNGTGGFGYSLSYTPSGSTPALAVGAPFVAPNGAAYLFTGPVSGVWPPAITMLPPSSIPVQVGGIQFGVSVALSPFGTTLYVGAPAQNVGNNTNKGAVYVFGQKTRTSWIQQEILTAPSTGAGAGAAFDDFGWSVAVAPNSAASVMGLIGAPSKTVGTTHFQGAAYAFSRFSVNVLVGTLLNLIRALTLPPGVQSQLTSIIEQLPVVVASFPALQSSLVTAAMNGFIGQVKGAMAEHVILPAQGDPLVAMAIQAIAEVSGH